MIQMAKHTEKSTEFIQTYTRSKYKIVAVFFIRSQNLSASVENAQCFVEMSKFFERAKKKTNPI